MLCDFFEFDNSTMIGADPPETSGEDRLEGHHEAIENMLVPTAKRAAEAEVDNCSKLKCHPKWRKLSFDDGESLPG